VPNFGAEAAPPGDGNVALARSVSSSITAITASRVVPIFSPHATTEANGTGTATAGSDQDALDAYSAAVIGAVGPAVVSVGLARPAPRQLRARGVPELRGAGSGVIPTPDR